MTYRSILPEGVEHTPPHVLIYDSFTTINGSKVPSRFNDYEDQALDAGCEIGNWSFDTTFDETRMSMPEGAIVDDSQP